MTFLELRWLQCDVVEADVEPQCLLQLGMECVTNGQCGQVY